MMGELSNYGLRELYNFKEIHIPTNGQLPDIHNKIINYISPAIIELESLGLIDGFHFILHKAMDLRLSAGDWEKNERSIREILRKNNLSDNLQNWDERTEMPPEHYGGDIGVILCFNNLEFNSRLILALIDLQKHTDDTAVRQRQASLVYGQWVHYLYIQYGLGNFLQVRLEFQDSLDWLETIIRRNPGNAQVQDHASKVLDGMNKEIKQFRKEFLHKQTEQM